MQSLTIGQVAKAAHVGVETIRFYERRGLIAVPRRRRSGYREYPRDAIRRVQFIRRAKALGFTLREIAELLSLRVDASTTCAEVHERAQLRITDIDERMAVLARMRARLEHLSRACQEDRPVGACPILDALNDDEVADGES